MKAVMITNKDTVSQPNKIHAVSNYFLVIMVLKILLRRNEHEEFVTAIIMRNTAHDSIVQINLLKGHFTIQGSQ